MDIIELLYQEHNRFNSAIDAMVSSSFSDFELLAVIGLMLAWKPISDRLVNGSDRDAANTLLLGFSVMLFVIAIISVRDLMKQSIVIFNINEIGIYSQEINRILKQQLKVENLAVFNSSENWKEWAKNTHIYISLAFRLLVLILIYFFPVVILKKYGRKFPLIYSAVYVFVVGIVLTSLFFLINSANN